MKKIIMIIMIFLSIFLISCEENKESVESIDNISKRSVEEGKIALASFEYDKAKNLFKLAVDESEKNNEAKTLLELTTDYLQLINIIESNEFNKIEQLILKIESNEKVNIIQDELNKIKNKAKANKDKFEIYSNEVTEIEKALQENRIEEAKSLAELKLLEVVGFKELEKRLNIVINSVDQIVETKIQEEEKAIDNAKKAVLVYYDNCLELIYEGNVTFDGSSGIFSNVEELYGIKMYKFREDSPVSPREYVYDENTGDVFMLKEGQVFWLNNGNLHLNKEIIEPEVSEILISREEATRIGREYFFSQYNFSEDEIIISCSTDVWDNKYLWNACINTGNKGVIVEYNIDATTGEITKIGQY